MKWDEWRGDFDGHVVMRTKHLVAWRGYKLDLHQFLAADRPGCRHTHPAKALRIILWNGYIEEYEAGDQLAYRVWLPFHIGLVRPEFCHRISSLFGGRPTYSLWLRWPKTHQIELRGEGWRS